MIFELLKNIEERLPVMKNAYRQITGKNLDIGIIEIEHAKAMLI